MSITFDLPLTNVGSSKLGASPSLSIWTQGDYSVEYQTGIGSTTGAFVSNAAFGSFSATYTPPSDIVFGVYRVDLLDSNGVAKYIGWAEVDSTSGTFTVYDSPDAIAILDPEIGNQAISDKLSSVLATIQTPQPQNVGNVSVGMMRAERGRVFTNSVTLYDSSGVVIILGPTDKIRAQISVVNASPVFTVSSDANTTNGSGFSKNSPAGGSNLLLIDADDLTFPPGTYTIFIDYVVSSQSSEWQNYSQSVFVLG